MAPNSLGSFDLELRTQFEEGVEVPRPLRIIKRSGTYTASDGSIELDEGALIVPRRFSSRALSTNTVGAQQEGPFGCLTIHKRRGKGLSDMISGSSPKHTSFRSSSDQLLEELLSGFSSRSSDWIERSQELEFQGHTPSRQLMLFPSHHLSTFHTLEHPKNSPSIRNSISPHLSASSTSSSNTLRISDHNHKPAFFKHPLFSFPKSKKSSSNKQPQPTQTALRELHTSHLNKRHHKLPAEINSLSTKHTKDFRRNNSKENIRRHLSEEVHKAPRQFRDSLRRSSTVISLHNIFRKLSLYRSASSKHMDPLQPVPSDEPTDTPTATPSTIRAGNMQSRQSQTPGNLDDLFNPAPVQDQCGLYGILGMNFDYEFDRNTPTNDNRLEWVLFKFYSTCQTSQQPCHEFDGSECCPFPGRNQELPEAVAELKFEDRYCELVELRLPIIRLNSGPCSIRDVMPGVDSRLEMRAVKHKMVFVVACLIKWRWPRAYLEDRIFATVITRWFSSEYPVRNVLSSRLDRPTVKRQGSDFVNTKVAREYLDKDEEYTQEHSDSFTWPNDLHEGGWNMISDPVTLACPKDF